MAKEEGKGREMARIEERLNGRESTRSSGMARSVDDLSLLRCGVTVTYCSGIWKKKFAAKENNNTRGKREWEGVHCLITPKVICIGSKVNRLVWMSN